jgi:hypothetical protein
MPKQEVSGWRARIPAAVASMTAATIERAARLLDKASHAVPLHRAKGAGQNEGTPTPPQSERAPGSRDDTH